MQDSLRRYWVACAVFAMICFARGALAQTLNPPPFEEPERPTPVSTYSEFELDEGEAWIFSQEVDAAFNGDLGKSGFAIRLLGAFGNDDYFSSDVGSRIDVNPVQLDLLLGYQSAREKLFWDAYVGVDYLDYQLSPNDPSNQLRGSETGVKVAGSVQTAEAKPIYAGAYGEYSTAYNTYFSQFRLGYRFGKIIAGPEGALLGDETFDGQRVGGWVYFPLKLTAKITPDIYVSGGYSFVNDHSGGGGFFPGAGSGNGGYFVVGTGLDF